MTPIIWSPQAADDIVGIQTYISADVEVLICSGFANYTPEIEATFEPLCGTVTTEQRGGEVAVVCTPSASGA